jgi:hypothetical protein
MKSRIIPFLIIALSLLSCDFRKSVHKDLITGLVTKGDGLSCEEVYLTIDEEKTDRTTFIYGETFYLNFSNIEGFSEENNNIFPGMIISVTDAAGDTIFQTEDMYANYLNGMNISPLALKSKLTVGTPMHSNHEYTVIVKIWDKKVKGTFFAEMPFNVIENEKIVIEKNNMSYDEIYLYSADRDRAITDGIVHFNENIYLIFEGLSGVTEENGNVYPGFKLLATDHSQQVILDYADLFESYAETGISAVDFKTQFYITLKFTEGQLDNPVHFEGLLFDNKGNSTLKVNSDLSVQ